MKRLYIKTYGCQMNEADSMRAAALLADEYMLVDTPEDADLVLINTCSVREKPEHKLYSDLGKLRMLKQRNPDMLIGVMGCVAQQVKEEIFTKAPWVNIVLGPDGIDDLPELVRKAIEGKQASSVRLRRNPESLFKAVQVCPRSPKGYVNVMKGCDKFCSFCIVPFTRGREASRKPETIFDEIEWLQNQGVKEIVLLGQNVTAYGKDLSPRKNLRWLIEEIAKRFDGIKRIRFLTSHPNDTDEELLEVFANEKVCPFLHLPLQAGSNRILKLMNRHYTVEEYLQKLEYVRKVRPKIALASDFIVGFPGETRKDFEQTLKVVKQVEYDTIYSFVFSPRPYTKAAKMPDPIPRQTKLEWLAELQAVQAEISHRKLEALVGTVQEVLIEGVSVKSSQELTGRTPCNKPVNIPLPESYIGAILQVRITEAMKNSLRGEPVNKMPAQGFERSEQNARQT